MRKKIVRLLAGVALVLGSSALALGQQPTQQPTTTTVTETPTKVTKTVQHPDGTYTVIEYPAKKEVKVVLNPMAPSKSTGFATILRDDDGTRIVLNLSEVPAEVKTLNLYAIDDTGAVSALGPITVTNGVGTLMANTPLSKFMLVASPEANLTTYDANTTVFFRSGVPEGLAVIPHTTVPVGEKVSATTAPATPAVTATTTAATPSGATVTTTSPAVTYSVPMLNIPAYKTGDDTKMKINFTGALTGARANVFIKPRKDGPTEIKLRFHELKEAPAGKVFTVWAVSPENKFAKLGQVVNTGQRNEAEIASEVALPDFGLLITMEDATSTTTNPLGPSIGVVEIIKTP